MTTPAPLSILVWSRRSGPGVGSGNLIQMQIVDVATTQDLLLREGSFLLRISTDEQAGIERCLIRHIASGRETYVQGSLSLREFVKLCLLDGNPLSQTGG